jgi:hypothetical protein
MTGEDPYPRWIGVEVDCGIHRRGVMFLLDHEVSVAPPERIAERRHRTDLRRVRDEKPTFERS